MKKLYFTLISLSCSVSHADPYLVYKHRLTELLNQFTARSSYININAHPAFLSLNKKNQQLAAKELKGAFNSLGVDIAGSKTLTILTSEEVLSYIYEQMEKTSDSNVFFTKSAFMRALSIAITSGNGDVQPYFIMKRFFEKQRYPLDSPIEITLKDRIIADEKHNALNRLKTPEAILPYLEKISALPGMSFYKLNESDNDYIYETLLEKFKEELDQPETYSRIIKTAFEDETMHLATVVWYLEKNLIRLSKMRPNGHEAVRAAIVETLLLPSTDAQKAEYFFHNINNHRLFWMNSNTGLVDRRLQALIIENLKRVTTLSTTNQNSYYNSLFKRWLEILYKPNEPFALEIAKAANEISSHFIDRDKKTYKLEFFDEINKYLLQSNFHTIEMSEYLKTIGTLILNKEYDSVLIGDESNEIGVRNSRDILIKLYAKDLSSRLASTEFSNAVLTRLNILNKKTALGRWFGNLCNTAYHEVTP